MIGKCEILEKRAPPQMTRNYSRLAKADTIQTHIHTYTQPRTHTDTETHALTHTIGDRYRECQGLSTGDLACQCCVCAGEKKKRRSIANGEKKGQFPASPNLLLGPTQQLEHIQHKSQSLGKLCQRKRHSFRTMEPSKGYFSSFLPFSTSFHPTRMCPRQRKSVKSTTR